MWNIFEQPWTMLIIAAISFLLVLILRAVAFEKPRHWLSLIPIVVVLLAFGLDMFVQTDPEQIRYTIDIAVKAVEDENYQAIEDTLAADYADSRHRSKDAIVKRAEDILEPPFVDRIYDSILEMNIAGQTAEVVLLNRILFDKQSDVAAFTSILLAKVKIELEKQSDNRWLIKRTEVLAINNQPAKWTDVSYNNF